MKRFLVSTICLNRKEGLRACLDALIAGNPVADFDLVLTDQASTDGTGEFMDSLRDNAPEQCPGLNITVFHEKENTGFQAPNLRAWRMAISGGYKFLLLLNDDTVPPPRMLAMLAQPFAANPKLALAGPAGTCCRLTNDFHGTGGSPVEYIEGSCMCINVELVRRIVGSDLWDKNLQFIYAEDSCLSLRVREAGAHIAHVPFQLQHTPNSTTMKGDPEVKALCVRAQENNHNYARRRWRHYLDTRRMDYPIVLKRAFAMGDALLLTPIIRAIRQLNPMSPLFVQTDFPAIFRNNPCVRQAERVIGNMNGALTIDLNNAYEETTNKHIVYAYADKVREKLLGLGEVELRTELFPDPTDEQWAQQVKMRACGKDGRIALIHPGPSWPGKTWEPSRFAEIATHLVLSGWHVICIGGQTKPPEIKDCINMCGQTPGALRLAALMKRAGLFVGIDSFPMHCALSMGTPTVGLFGVTTTRYIMTNGAPHVGIDANPLIPSAGLRHRTIGVLHLPDGADAINSISVAEVKNAINKVLQ